VLNDLTVLNEFSLDFNEITIVISVELGDNCDWLGGVDLELRSLTIEVFDTSSEWVEVAAVLVAVTVESVIWVVTAGNWILTFLLSFDVARMCCVSGRNLISLPDVHLGTAGTHFTNSSIWVSGGWLPSLDISLTINELDVVWALSIAISSTVCSTGIVTITLVSGLLHLDEVEGTVDTAWKLRNIHGECELFSEKLEHHVFLLGIEHERSGSDVLAVLTLSDELELKGSSIGLNTVWGSPVALWNTVESTVLSARLIIWAELAIP
jgi:hypothetical protein